MSGVKTSGGNMREIMSLMESAFQSIPKDNPKAILECKHESKRDDRRATTEEIEILIARVTIKYSK